MPGKPPVGTKGIGCTREASPVQGLLIASYMGESVTLSPAMTLDEFRSELVKLDRLRDRVASERGRREASRQ